MGVGEGGFSGIMPCFRKMSFLNIVINGISVWKLHNYHSVSACGSSTGTLTGTSIVAMIEKT